jgi:two-component system, sensor histidine kinase and response regulator
MSSSARRVDIAAPGAVRTAVPAQLLHDLRNPLNQIIGYSEMLSEEPEVQQRDTLAADVAKIRNAGHEMLTLIELNFTAGTETRPAARAQQSAPADVVAPVTADTNAGGLLLVVDDDATNRDVLSRRLRKQGHAVMTASSGREALTTATSTAFDVVLLDVMMPEMDGYEVLRQFKSNDQLSHIPIIMISALSEVQSVVRCIEAGAEDYLPKPFDPTLLKARISASLERKRGRDRETLLFEQLQKNYVRLLNAERLRDDMRNMIVHDLRTPLTAVIVAVDMLGRHGSLSPTQETMVSIASNSGKTLLGMINDLLDVEKMESGVSQLHEDNLSASTLIGDAVAQVASLASDSGTRIVTSVEPGLAMFRGDQNKLSRTLVNLIANAIKFTGAGVVTISASQDDDGATRFTIRDTGRGIPHEAFDTIFEKFSQLEGQEKVGTGLGLAFCKLAVEAHGGNISVESEQGTGSAFSFTIPARPLTSA